MKKISKENRIKRDVVSKILPTMLAGQMLFSSGILVNSASSYSLEAPEIGYQDYLAYDGVRIFINGRYVSFNDNTGYPFINDGVTMIPLRAVSEAYGALVGWNNSSRKASVRKYDYEALISVDENMIEFKDLDSNRYKEITIGQGALIKDGRTYIPLRSLFECFGMNVRWDDVNKIAHIETVSDLSFIDFKNVEVQSIHNIDLNSINKFVFDGEEVSREYINILLNSDQYKVVVDGSKANIYSYQFLSNINYIYSKGRNFMINYKQLKYDAVDFRNITNRDIKFLSGFVNLTSLDGGISCNSIKDGEIADSPVNVTRFAGNMLDEVLREASLIVNEVRNSTSDKLEQARLATNILAERIKYDYDNDSLNNIYGALVRKDTKCTGYARALNLIMNELGIPSVYYGGSEGPNEPGHAWNEVYIDGTWYICDSTHGLALIPLDESSYLDKYYYSLDESREIRDLVKLTYSFE